MIDWLIDWLVDSFIPLLNTFLQESKKIETEKRALNGCFHSTKLIKNGFRNIFQPNKRTRTLNIPTLIILEANINSSQLQVHLCTYICKAVVGDRLFYLNVTQSWTCIENYIIKIHSKVYNSNTEGNYMFLIQPLS